MKSSKKKTRSFEVKCNNEIKFEAKYDDNKAVTGTMLSKAL